MAALSDEELVVVAVRIPRRQAAELDALAREFPPPRMRRGGPPGSRSATIRQLLTEALEQRARAA